MARSRLGWKDLVSAPTSGTVLIVDDDAEVRKSLQRLVTRLGYSVTTVASAEEADNWLTQQRFMVCILDIELPRMSGVEFLDWALRRDPEMAVLMLTGMDVPEIAIECIDGGARTYLVKPVEVDFLRLALRDALAFRRILVERNDLVSRGIV
jgi:two-component system C4-dicarboxylate transport response regulator DctD